MRPLYEYTLDALRQMVGVSAVTQERALKGDAFGKAKSMSDLQFLEEFCTIRLGGPRQCGHTTALIQLAQERFANWVILITPDPHTFSRNVEDKIRERWGNRNRISVVRGANGLRERFVWTPGSVDAIMVDNANHWDHTQLRRIQLDTHHLAKHRLERGKPFFYIYVQ